MQCSTVRTWLFRSIDGELTASEARDLNFHLQECISCAREQRLLSIPRRIGRAAPVLEPSPFFYSRLKARLASESQSLNIWQLILALSRHLVPALAAITLALLSVFAYFQIQAPQVDLFQAYDRIFVTGDRPQSIFAADQGEITDESVIRAIAEEESARSPAAGSDQNRK